MKWWKIFWTIPFKRMEVGMDSPASRLHSAREMLGPMWSSEYGSMLEDPVDGCGWGGSYSWMVLRSLESYSSGWGQPYFRKFSDAFNFCIFWSSIFILASHVCSFCLTSHSDFCCKKGIVFLHYQMGSNGYGSKWGTLETWGPWILDDFSLFVDWICMNHPCYRIDNLILQID